MLEASCDWSSEDTAQVTHFHHAETNKEVSAQAVSYTTGVPPVSGAAMFFRGEWSGKGVFNVEQFPAKPFLEDVAQRGLPWHVIDIVPGDQDELFAVET